MTIFVVIVRSLSQTIKQKTIFHQKFFWMSLIQRIFQSHFAVMTVTKVFRQMKNILPVLLSIWLLEPKIQK